MKTPPANTRNARGVGAIPRLGRYPGEGNGNTYQYYCLENSIDRGAWWVRVHRVAKSRTTYTDKLQKHREVGTNRDGGKVDWTELHAKIEQKLLPLFLIRKTSLI